MIKYAATAVALKMFSATPQTRRLYRQLGNRFGNQRRQKEQMPGFYVDRVKRVLGLAQRHNIVKDGDRVLELGTGWLHWEALTLRLFYDIEAVVYDVWDNRQLGALKNYVSQLRRLLPSQTEISAQQLRRATAVIDEVLTAESFDDLYRTCRFQYVVESTGSLQQFAEASFDLVVSAGVLEHVKRESVHGLVPELHRVLKPGGWALHSIDTSDHLAHYDARESKKRYLSFSENTWKRFLENDLQYINRLQRSEWLALFRSAPFDIVEEESRFIDLDGLKLASHYTTMPAKDAECTVLRLALRKHGTPPLARENLRATIAAF